MSLVLKSGRFICVLSCFLFLYLYYCFFFASSLKFWIFSIEFKAVYISCQAGQVYGVPLSGALLSKPGVFPEQRPCNEDFRKKWIEVSSFSAKFMTGCTELHSFFFFLLILSS